MSIYKRGNSWTVQISWYISDPSGKKKKFKTEGGFRTKSQAKRWENEQIVSKNKNSITNENPIFADYFWKWAMTYRIPEKTDGTKRRYSSISNVVKKYFGTTRINDINRSVYQNFINKYGENHSKVTIKKLNGILKSCVSDAHEEGIIPQNFTNRIKVLFRRILLIELMKYGMKQGHDTLNICQLKKFKLYLQLPKAD